jgi:hypothetical protein
MLGFVIDFFFETVLFSGLPRGISQALSLTDITLRERKRSMMQYALCAHKTALVDPVVVTPV